ncbi:hypothetical protein WMY93_026018 [Mugilogobius chulae]|uniref:Uncharacterized protein n=1 Tax=Mugilogobius chulae TaxID=88201 RepID=A0AAW0MWA4_9GOBI
MTHDARRQASLKTTPTKFVQQAYYSMEVSRRKILQKHLEPARPLRRCFHVNIEASINHAACAQIPQAPETMIEAVSPEPYIGIEQFYKILNLHKKEKERIAYTRDFLIALANCPESGRDQSFYPSTPLSYQTPETLSTCEPATSGILRRYCEN